MQKQPSDFLIRIKDSESTALYLSFCFFVVAVIISALVSRSQNGLLDRAIATKAEHTKTIVLKNASMLASALNRMGSRWQINRRTNEQVWRSDAANYLRDLSGIEALWWVDGSFKNRWIVSAENSDVDIDDSYLSHIDLTQQLEKYDSLHEPQFSPVVQLSDDKFVVYILQPLTVDDQFDGFFVSRININEFLLNILGDAALSGFMTKVMADDLTVFDDTTDINYSRAQYSFSLDMDDDQAGWTFIVYPSSMVYHLFKTPLPYIITSSGLLIGFLLYSVMVSRIRAKAQTNHLTKEISEKKVVQSRLQHMVNHDPLTHLPNRAYLNIYLDNKIKECQSLRKQLAVIILDVDYFKDINDCWGHGIGDRILKAVASRLDASLNREQLLARMDGNEFVICMDGKLIKESMFIHADDLLKSLRKSFQIDGKTIRLTASIGIAYLGEHANNVSELISKASAACYDAKKMGRDTYAIYDNKISRELVNRSQIIKEINKALNNGEFEMMLQPRHNVRSGKMVSAEALVRWRKGKEVIPPDYFLGVAEDTGLILKISQQSFSKVFSCYHDLFNGNPNVMLSINISAKQLEHPDFLNDLFSLLDQYDFPSNMLEIELTEQVLIQNFEASMKTLEILHEAGILIAIDDFGTGYSSLSYLKNFPVDVLKIDRSFIQDIHKDKGSVEIVRAIIAMGKSLKMEIVAEGVETREQLEILQHEGCDQVQGYYFSRPLFEEDFKKLFGQNVYGRNALMD